MTVVGAFDAGPCVWFRDAQGRQDALVELVNRECIANKVRLLTRDSISGTGV